MTSGDVFSSSFSTSAGVSVQPANDVVLTFIMTNSDNGRLDLGGGNYARQAEQRGGDYPATSTDMAKWAGGSMTNMKLFLTNSTFISLNSSSGSVKFFYSGIEI